MAVRRSSRRSSSQLQSERAYALEKAIAAGDESGVRVVESADKGRGVVSARHFDRADMVLEYRGELISRAEAREREGRYADDASVGCYMFYFALGGQQYWCVALHAMDTLWTSRCCSVDATAETTFAGRLVNHSAKRANLLVKAVHVMKQPRLILVAARMLEPGEELLYDYGDRNKDVIALYPWLRD